MMMVSASTGEMTIPGLVFLSFLAMVILIFQLPAALILLGRLMSGPTRRPPLQPKNATINEIGAVSVLLPTLNEAARIQPCLSGLTRQGYEVREILVVDSCSTDGTQDRVKQTQSTDPRFRLITDDPLPPGWVGRPWALHTGFVQSSPRSRWMLGIDADTLPQPGLVAALVQAAEAEGYDLVSLAPQFILKTPGELFLQPALLMTLIYRFGPAGLGEQPPERVMANGQCFLCRRSWLEQLQGYTAAAQSFCDDVTLARYAAAQGAKVGFWDGARLLKVRMYEGAAETWREWGRSLDLKDAASKGQLAWDVGFLIAVQGLPWLLMPLILGGLILGKLILGGPTGGLLEVLSIRAVFALNLGLLLVRLGLQVAIRPSYDLSETQVAWIFWLAPLADPLAVWRIITASLRVPTEWRGRTYGGSHQPVNVE